LSKIKICSLGGIGENGKNLYIVDVDDRMFILDAGLIYPDIDSYGIDAVVPNIDYLKENENRIVGIFLSHGHEDHIGAIAYILDNIKCPIYASTFTILLLEEFLKANDRKIKDYELHRVGRGKTLKFGDVSVSFIRVNHSLPETTIIVLGTKDGKIIYAPDFNFSVAINKNYEVDYDKLLELSKSKVLVTMAESIGISGNNRTFNDDLFTSSLFNSIDRVKGNTYVICYSTDIGRIQQITDMAYAMNKKVGIIGLKNEAVTDMAIKNHYLDIKPEMFAGRNIESSSSQVVFIVGIYTEPYYLISKMLKGQVKGVTLGKDDLIITLSNMSAGNTNYALSVIDEIYRHDIPYMTIDKNTFRTSHATNQDLNQLYQITNPKYIIPIKGEVRHIERHLNLIKQIGMSDRVLDISEGKMVEIVDSKYKSFSFVKTGKVYIDGTQVGVVDDSIIEERNQLGEHGIISIIVYIDKINQTIIKEPNIITKGFAYNKLDEEKLQEIKDYTVNSINKNLFLNKNNKTIKEVEGLISTGISRLVYRYIKEEVIILPIIQNVFMEELNEQVKQNKKIVNSKTKQNKNK